MGINNKIVSEYLEYLVYSMSVCELMHKDVNACTAVQEHTSGRETYFN